MELNGKMPNGEPLTISKEAFSLACAVLKCASKTSIANASNELDALFYSPQELQKLRHIREMWRQRLEDSLGQEIQKN